MPIPDSPPFQELFSALELGTFDDSTSLQPDAITIINPMAGVMADGKRVTYKGVAIRLKKKVTVTVQGLIGKISQELKNKNHPHDDSVCLAVLGCAIFASRSPEEVPVRLNRWFESINEATVSHFFILESETEMPTTSMDGYRLGPLEISQVRRLSKLAQSDFAELYGDRLKNRLCLHAPEFRRPVIDFLDTMKRDNLFSETWMHFLLNYFERIAQVHFDMMWNHLESAQQLRSAFELDFFDSELFRKLPGTQMVSVYLDFSKVPAGYVVPNTRNLTVFLPSPNQVRAQAIEKAYGLNSIGDSELGRILKTLSRFHHQGRRYLRAEAYNEAALQFVIVLELLFAERESISESVRTRTAAVAHLALGKTYQDACKEMKSLYGSRSNFVHSGKDISEEQACRLLEYSQAVLRVLFTLHLTPSNHHKDFIQKWLKLIDWVKASYDADLKLDPAILREHGLGVTVLPAAN